MEKTELKFEAESLSALKIMENTNKCMYLTWKAWAWKSTLINYFISKTRKKFILLWTTWISAINIWWQTIHSFFNIRPKGKSTIKADTRILIKETDIFIIDEVSMMRADLFDKVERIFRMVMWKEEFMWGKQVIFVWDLFQLPPVPERKETIELEEYNEKYKWLFFFNWNSFLKEHMKILELKKVYRQKDPQFIYMLNRMRVWDNSRDVLNYFNSRAIKTEEVNEKAILIATTNKIVNEKNELELDKLDWDIDISTAIIRWEYPEDSYPTERVLKLKVWARIMFTVNDNKNFDYVNWTLWTVIHIQYNSRWFMDLVKIKTDDWPELSIVKNVWNEIEWQDPMTWEDIIVWTFVQFPFKLAFAITIHKVQGKSFDHVVIDLGWGAFAEGQTYVAVSRCRQYEWLQFLKPVKAKDIKVSLDVIKFLK